MSALEGEGVKELRELLAGRCSAVFIASHVRPRCYVKLVSMSAERVRMAKRVVQVYHLTVLKGTSILVGNSGVGKSHLLNRLGEVGPSVR